MKNKLFFRIVSFALISMFILAMGASTFAAKPIDNSVNWSYLTVCTYNFYKSSDYVAYCSGSTTVSSSKYAYVKVELQKFTDKWETIATLTDDDQYAAAADDYIAVDHGYTYRLKLTHKAKTAAGTTLETFTQYSYTLVI